MIVDQHGTIGRVITRMTRHMDLPDGIAGEAGDPGACVKADVVSRHIDIVDVEQQPTAGTSGELGKELRFAHDRLGEVDIGREILDEDLALQGRLRQIDVAGKDRERLFVVRDRQEVIQVDPVADAPGKMLGYELRLEAVANRLETKKM